MEEEIANARNMSIDVVVPVRYRAIGPKSPSEHASVDGDDRRGFGFVKLPIRGGGAVGG